MKAKKYLYLSICMVLIFACTVTYYIIGPLYAGILPIGIITGSVLFVQIFLLFISAKNLLITGLQWRIILAIGIEGISILGMGYFFIVWLMVI